MLAVVLLMVVSMWDPAEAVGGARSRPRPQRRPPKKPKVEPTDATPLAQNIDMEQVRTWRSCRSHTEQKVPTFYHSSILFDFLIELLWSYQNWSLA